MGHCAAVDKHLPCTGAYHSPLTLCRHIQMIDPALGVQEHAPHPRKNKTKKQVEDARTRGWEDLVLSFPWIWANRVVFPMPHFSLTCKMGTGAPEHLTIWPLSWDYMRIKRLRKAEAPRFYTQDLPVISALAILCT